ncbi:hypothetical protein B0H14DRAFT_2559544 [Mycena olivaceomarginata]|nr:hypothetical protein B0H14DRAFT_2559544 [Mycena olivaceomarginata]
MNLNLRFWSSPSAAAPAPVAIPYLPASMDSLDTPNPLHGPENAGQKRSYHIVYCGITPGVYQSYSSSLECALNTLSIRGAVFDSCGSKQLAVQQFEDAVSGGRIKPLMYCTYCKRLVEIAKGTEKKPTQASFDAQYLIALRTLHAFLGIPDEEYKLTIYIAVLNKSIHGPGRGLSSKLSSSFGKVASNPALFHWQRKLEEQRVKTRARMARYRLNLKSVPPEKQEASKQRAREARARYRDRNQPDLLAAARCKRMGAYPEREAATQAKGKPRRRAPVSHSDADESNDGSDDSSDTDDSDPETPLRLCKAM